MTSYIIYHTSVAIIVNNLSVSFRPNGFSRFLRCCIAMFINLKGTGVPLQLLSVRKSIFVISLITFPIISTNTRSLVFPINAVYG